MAFDSLTDRSEAGPLIPEDAADEIIKNATLRSYAMSAFKRKRMSRKQRRMPILDRKPVAYFVNGDTGLKETSDLRWDNIYLNAEELAVIVPIPDTVVDDADWDIWQEVRPELEEAIAAKIDDAIFFGVDRPVTWPVGVLQGATAAGQTVAEGTSAVDVFDDMNTAMTFLEVDGYEPRSWLLRPQFKSVLRSTRDLNKGFLYPPTGPANTGAARAGWAGAIWNVPAFVSMMGLSGFADGAGNAEAFVLDTDQFMLAVRNDISMKIFTEGVISDDTGKVLLNLMQQDSKALRCTIRVAWAVANPVTRIQPDRTKLYPAAVVTQA